MTASEVSTAVQDGGDGARAPSSRFAHVRALDGVRGLAVALVVLYHFAPDLLPAGFLGVDVFFVLSGFLITSLALGEHRTTGRVSVAGFFSRRARRLLPAALTTIVVAVAIAIWLDPDAYRHSLRGQAVASVLYLNNWWAIAQNDTYQAVFGAESPLTHFWSLSIEEQFYFVFPFVVVGLVALARRRSSMSLARTLLVLASVGAIASAVLMATLYDPLVEPSRLYYGTDTRLQAVLLGVAGGCVTTLWRDRIARTLPRWGWTAVAAIGTAVLLIASIRGGFLQSWLYRGGFFAIALTSLLVVVAVVVHRGPTARVFELRPLVTLGLFSYGIYLWHWPVKVFLDEARTGLHGIALFALRCAVTAVATFLSYRLIEAPFRSPRTGDESPRMVRALRSPRGAMIAVGSMVVAIALVWVIARPSTEDFTNSVAAAPDVATHQDPLRVIWTGDSVAWTMGGGTFRFPQPSGYETIFDPDEIVLWNLATYSCPMIAATSRSMGRVRSDTSTCWDRSTSWPADIEQFHADMVVWNAALFDLTDVHLDGRWVAFGSTEWDEVEIAALEQARIAATADGSLFVLMGQPDAIGNRSEALNEALLPENIGRFAHLRDLQRAFAARHPNDTRYIDLQQLLCPGDVCPEVVASGAPFRLDGVHLSPDGARSIVPLITDALQRAAGRSVPN